MAIVYIDPNADAGGDGSTTNLSSGDNTHALQALLTMNGTGGGNTYSCRGGSTSVYTDRIQIKNVTDVTINSYGTGRHTFDFSGSSNKSGSIWIQVGTQDTVLDNIIVTSPPDDGILAGDGIVIENAGNVTIKNFSLTSPGTWDRDQIGIHMGSTSAAGGFTEIFNFDIVGFTRGLRVDSQTPAYPINIYNGYIEVDGDDSFYDHISGFRVNTQLSYGTDFNYELKLSNLEIVGASATGVTTGAATNAIFENIYIHGFVMRDPVLQTSGSGFNLGTPTITPTTGCIIRNCLIIDEEVSGIYNGISTRNNTNYNCHNNVIIGCHAGISVGTSTANNNVYKNNTIINNWQGIRNTDAVTGTVFDNNIVTGINKFDSNQYGINEVSGEVTYSNNCFDVDYLTATGTDGGENIRDTDPLLDPEYFPLPTSPCIDAGTTKLSDFDAYGRPAERDHIGAAWPLIETSGIRRGF
jgi:hypothetical protein